jgi:hypothetical protein
MIVPSGYKAVHTSCSVDDNSRGSAYAGLAAGLRGYLVIAGGLVLWRILEVALSLG